MNDENERLAIQFVEAVVAAGVKEGCSDIHLEPLREESVVRFRCGGALQEISRHSADLGLATRRAVKRMFQGDVAVEDVPQDGRILFDSDGQPLDVRVSLFPTVYGERMVFRFQDTKFSQRLTSEGLDSLDLGSDQRQQMHEFFQSPFGLVLVSGLIGSGRTDTMYAALCTLVKSSQGRSNLISLEGPVETFLPGVVQTRIYAKGELSYSGAVRASMRQDPDALFCANVPDAACARELIQAALTGHLVAARVTAADAAAALAGLIEMAAEPAQLHQLSMVLRGVTCQRMARRLCDQCKVKAVLTPPQKKLVRDHLGGSAAFYRSSGCQACKDTGFRGRASLYQVVPCDPPLIDLLLQRPSLPQLRQAMQPGLLQCALQSAARGLVSLDEAVRATA